MRTFVSERLVGAGKGRAVHAANAEGRAQRNADFAEAAKMIDGASVEARRMASFRELANWISSAHAS